jgi:hypothetical protein
MGKSLTRNFVSDVARMSSRILNPTPDRRGAVVRSVVGLEHVGQQVWIVLVIGVHHRDDRCGGRQHALDRGGRQPAPVDTLDHPYLGIAQRQHPRFVGGAVRTIVVDEDRFPRNPGQRHVQPVDQRGKIVTLVERRQHDGKFERPQRDVDCGREIEIAQVHIAGDTDQA